MWLNEIPLQYVLVRRRIVVYAGFILMALGIGGLFGSHVLASSANAAANSWWVGTLQALGVGFIVGGLVDVLAISGLDAVRRDEEKRVEFNRRAWKILTDFIKAESEAALQAAAAMGSASEPDRSDEIYGRALDHAAVQAVALLREAGRAIDKSLAATMANLIQSNSQRHPELLEPGPPVETLVDWANTSEEEIAESARRILAERQASSER